MIGVTMPAAAGLVRHHSDAVSPVGIGLSPFAGRLRRKEWEVRAVELREVRELVMENHYSRSASNTAVYSFGLFRRGGSACLGACLWLPPLPAAARAAWPARPGGVLCLSRLVVLPGVPKNAVSFLVGRAVRRIDRGRWPVLVSYADEWQGHEGRVYLAAGWEYVRKTRPMPVFVKDGRVISPKAGSKKPTRSTAEMLAQGCELVGYFRKNVYRMVTGSAAAAGVFAGGLSPNTTKA
jgi:hypothetical protein